MKGKAGDIVKISGVYREVTEDGIAISELICIKNEIFPPTDHVNNCYEIKMVAYDNDTTYEI